MWRFFNCNLILKRLKFLIEAFDRLPLSFSNHSRYIMQFPIDKRDLVILFGTRVVCTTVDGKRVSRYLVKISDRNQKWPLVGIECRISSGHESESRAIKLLALFISRKCFLILFICFSISFIWFLFWVKGIFLETSGMFQKFLMFKCMLSFGFKDFRELLELKLNS